MNLLKGWVFCHVEGGEIPIAKPIQKWSEKIYQALAFSSLRHAGKIALLGTILAVVGAYFSVQLYMNLRTSIEELLPTNARSIRDLNLVAERLKSLDNIVVLVFSENEKQSKKFVLDLAQELEKAPQKIVSLVEYRIDRELQFFKDRRALYIDLEDLEKIEDYVDERIAYEKELYNPMSFIANRSLKEPRFDYEALKKKYQNKLAGYDRFPDGFYATADEKVRAVVVYMPGKGLDKVHRLKEEILKAVSKLQPKTYAEDLEVKYTGNGQNLIEESAALIEDLELSTVIVIVLVTAAMVFFFRSFLATVALSMSLFVGTLWTFGVSYFTVGYLNANTAFLASIVIGNGINFAIILLARYLEERRRDEDHASALLNGIRATVPPTATAALAAGLSYGSLMLTGFRGFSQFGVIGLVGMVFCWLSAFTVFPSYLTLLDRWFGKRWVSLHEPKAYFSGAIASFVGSVPRMISIFTVIAVVASFFAIRNYRAEIIETDLSKLRDKRSVERGSGALYHYIDDIFGHSFSPMVILPETRKASRRIASRLKEIRDQDGNESPITLVQTLDDFVPTNQDAKVNVIRRIKRNLPKRLIRLLPSQEKRQIRELLTPASLTPFTEKDLPPLILDKFREADGTLGKIVLVDKSISETGEDHSTDIARFVNLGRSVADSVAPNSPVAGDLPVSFDMFQAITVDGPRATVFAFGAVVLLVVVLFRSFKTSALVLGALCLGVTWLAGLIFGFDLKINFLNFIALPITFGIGVDYGVNIFERYRMEGPGKILTVVKQTGGAVMLCSLTTIIGYGSLLLAGNQAFVSFGLLSVLGEITCMIAAVVCLPALLQGNKKKVAL